jgi:hypothetical protein
MEVKVKVKVKDEDEDEVKDEAGTDVMRNIYKLDRFSLKVINVSQSISCLEADAGVCSGSSKKYGSME